MLMNALSVIIGLLGTIALSNTLSFDLEKTAYTNSTVAFLFLLMCICTWNIRINGERSYRHFMHLGFHLR